MSFVKKKTVMVSLQLDPVFVHKVSNHCLPPTDYAHKQS